MCGLRSCVAEICLDVDWRSLRRTGPIVNNLARCYPLEGEGQNRKQKLECGGTTSAQDELVHRCGKIEESGKIAHREGLELEVIVYAYSIHPCGLLT